MNDDKITIQCDLLIIDNTISDNATSYMVLISTFFNSYFSLNSQNQIQLERLTNERPILNTNAQFLTNLNVPVSGSVIQKSKYSIYFLDKLFI